MGIGMGFPQVNRPAGAAGGDLSGTYPNPTVAKINGTALGTLTGATNGQGLVWNGSAWAPASLAWKLIASFTVTTPISIVELSNIPQTYTHLRLVCIMRSDTVAESDNWYLILNGDTAAHYDTEILTLTGTNNPTNAHQGGVATIAGGAVMAAANATAGAAGIFFMDLPFYTGTTWRKIGTFQVGYVDIVASPANQGWEDGLWNWRSTAAITDIQIAPANGNAVAGSVVDLYGY